MGNSVHKPSQNTPNTFIFCPLLRLISPGSEHPVLSEVRSHFYLDGPRPSADRRFSVVLDGRLPNREATIGGPGAHWVLLADDDAPFGDWTTFMENFESSLSGLMGEDWRATLLLHRRNLPSRRGAEPVVEGQVRRPQSDFISNSFYLHMLVHYGWGQLLGTDSCVAFVRRLLSDPSLFRMSPSVVKTWRADLRRLWEVADARRGSLEITKRDFVGWGEQNFLPTLAAVYQLGCGERSAAEQALAARVPWLGFDRSPDRLSERIRRVEQDAVLALRTENRGFEAPNDVIRRQLRSAALRNRLRARAMMLDHLSDLTRCAAEATAQWAVEACPEGETLRILVFADPASDGGFVRSLPEAIKAAFREGTVTLYCLRNPDSGARQDWGDVSWWEEVVHDGEEVEVTRMPPATNGGTHQHESRSLFDFDVLVVEADSHGASVVEWLESSFDDLDYRAQANGHAKESKSGPPRRPQSLLFGKPEVAGRFGHLTGLGAQEVVPRNRPFLLPARLTAVRVGRKRLRPEPRNSRPNFRALYSLPSRDANALKSAEDDDIVRGDEFDRHWVESLPKADLHFHIGTSVSWPVIEALAFNSSGYFLSGDLPAHLLDTVCKVVVQANILAAWRAGASPLMSPPEAVWSAARGLTLAPAAKPRHCPTRDVFDDVVRMLTPADRPVAKFECCSLLVAAFALFSYEQGQFGDGRAGASATPERAPLAPWGYFADQAKQSALGTLGERGREIEILLDYHLRRINENWHDIYTAANRPRLPRDYKVGISSDIWRCLYDHVRVNVSNAYKLMHEKFVELLLPDNRGWYNELLEVYARGDGPANPETRRIQQIGAEFARGCELSVLIDPSRREPNWKPLRLSDLVTIPTGQATGKGGRSLSRYLWGAGLLGAEHLQYAENLLLATADLTAQAVRENIVYSEVRCSTTGYCEGGMNAPDATDLLCVGFDLAACYFGTGERTWVEEPIRRRWVRTNVLLGAKRHKQEAEFEEIVSLLISYVNKGRDVPVRSFPAAEAPTGSVTPTVSLAQSPGPWWDRCRVVGFDMSGDETSQQGGVERHIQRLFTLCTPITIHAGEAADAESIWKAVHEHGAVRIGHGLRLRENQRLLDYCVNRGICMEMCPLSNAFTNEFEMPAEYKEPISESLRSRTGDRHVYPLRHFLDAGLDVCINTDNRYLHPPGQNRLTDDYLMAARLAGGLTKWELLKVVKAGFKHAFLPKVEVAALLRYVESEVNRAAVSDDSRLIRFGPT